LKVHFGVDIFLEKQEDTHDSESFDGAICPSWLSFWLPLRIIFSVPKDEVVSL